MDTFKIWDAVIVGGGIVGSWTAYSLLKEGLKNVLILDQFNLPHSRGSSHGHSRLIRRAYHKDNYGNMISDSYDMWMEFQRTIGSEIYLKTGMLSVEDADQKMNNAYRKVLDKNKITYNMLSSEEIQQKYPMLNFPKDHKAVYTPDAGLLLSQKSLQALRKAITDKGGVIRDFEKVEHIKPGAEVTVTTNKFIYKCRSIVLTPGPWANDVLQKVGLDLPIKTMPGWPSYWKTTGEYDMKAASGFPIVKYDIKLEKGYRFVTMFPELEYPGMVKIPSRGEPVPNYLHPDEIAQDDSGPIVKTVQEYLQSNVKGVKQKPSIIEGCMYTVTADGSCILDTHPVYDNVVLGVGFSGIGFITAPVAGKLLAQLVMKKSVSHNIEKLRMSRFGNPFLKHSSKL